MSGRGGDKGNGPDEIFYVVLVAAIVIVAWATWHLFREPIVYASLGLDWLQLQAMRWTVGLGKDGTGYLAFIEAVFDGRYAAREVAFAEISKVSTDVGAFTRYVIAPLLIVLAAVLFFRMKGEGYSRRFSLAGGKKGPSFAHYQAEYWKVTLAGAHFNPDAPDPQLDPAKTPLEWMRDNRIRHTDRDPFDPDDVSKVFEQQLGDPWPGFEKAPAHVRGVVVVCALNALRDKKVQAVKDSLAECWILRRKSAPSETEKLVAPFLENKKVRKFIDSLGSRHAYTTTVLYGMLEQARKRGGVLATAEITWLKSVDRTLWYGLNNCGRRAFLVEGAGIVSHYFAEKVLGTPLAKPHVDQAVTGVELYIEEQSITDLDRFFSRSQDD
jgi:hypothetical protein